MSNSNFKIPEELKGVTKDSLNRLDEKLANCYSKDRYQEFEENVEKIVLKTIGTDGGREITKKHSKEATKEYLEEKGWQNKNFWIPTLIGITGVVVAVIAIFYKTH